MNINKLKNDIKYLLSGEFFVYRKAKKLGIFDKEYYLHMNEDVMKKGMNPLIHYKRYGWKEGRNPSRIFNTRFYLKAYSDVSRKNINPIFHYIKYGIKKGFDCLPRDEGGQLIKNDSSIEVPIADANDYLEAKKCGVLDPVFYIEQHYKRSKDSLVPIDHFARFGWKDLCNPSKGFDICWYTQNYLGGDFSKNALLHYIREGEKAGYQTSPQVPIKFKTPIDYVGRTGPVRRICLFAGYDQDGLIDDYVVEYLTDLAQFCDVYYLADCSIDPDELKKLEGLTKGAWGFRHGGYDFGSWAELARNLVGWEIVTGYDELIFANDSCYLVRPLKNIFEKMDSKPCDWWGMQATKGLARTFATQALPEITSIEDIKTQWLDKFEDDPLYDFLVGSFFVAYRKNVISDTKFQDIINSIGVESKKINIIRKYEIGLTRWLISAGYEFDVFVDNVYPWQPVYSNTIFDMVEKGFPFFKRYFLSENHYSSKGLFFWKERLKNAGVEKDLSIYESNLLRVAESDKLYHNTIGIQDGDPWTDAEIRYLDTSTPKYDNWWAFPVCSFSHLFSDNLRGLFESVKDDPSIKKIILTRSKDICVSGKNTIVVPLKSRKGQFYLLRSRQVFLKHTISGALYPLSSKLHNFYNLWHGIPLKRINYASLDYANKLKQVEKLDRALRAVICASDVDRLAMASAFWPLTYHDIWQTGLPRHDFITCSSDKLPSDMKGEQETLEKIMNGRKMILFVPTFRNNQDSGYYHFSEQEKSALDNFLHSNNLVLGVREHMADKAKVYSYQLSGDNYIDLSNRLYPDVEVLYRNSVMLITDYSSSFIDFLLTKRPVISFAYDYDYYISEERGLFYDLDWVFPGIIAKTFDALLEGMNDALEEMTEAQKSVYDIKSKVFLKFYDSNNGERVRNRVLEKYKGSRTVLKRASRGNKTILCVYDRFSTPSQCALFRFPPELEKRGWNARFINSAELSGRDFIKSTLVVMHNVPLRENLIDMLESFKIDGGKIIIQLDQIPLSSDQYFSWIMNNKDNNIENINRLLSDLIGIRESLFLADFIITSTEERCVELESLGFGSELISKEKLLPAINDLFLRDDNKS